VKLQLHELETNLIPFNDLIAAWKLEVEVCRAQLDQLGGEIMQASTEEYSYPQLLYAALSDLAYGGR
jgi:hypothetical protein